MLSAGSEKGSGFFYPDLAMLEPGNSSLNPRLASGREK